MAEEARPGPKPVPGPVAKALGVFVEVLQRALVIPAFHLVAHAIDWVDHVLPYHYLTSIYK